MDNYKLMLCVVGHIHNYYYYYFVHIDDDILHISRTAHIDDHIDDGYYCYYCYFVDDHIDYYYYCYFVDDHIDCYSVYYMLHMFSARINVYIYCMLNL